MLSRTTAKKRNMEPNKEKRFVGKIKDTCKLQT